VYCNGINLTAAAGTVTFNPGTYILKGGGLNLNGVVASIQGTGVTFYNTYDATYPYGPINIQSTFSAVSFTAPTTGSLAGILFFQDRSVVSSTANTFNDFVAGTSLEGAMYFPTTPVSFAAALGGAHYTILVADTINYTGFLGFFNNDYSVLPGGSPIKNSGLLVE
jgi:hypothetical protein